ncbi:MAG: hypothetical protein AAGK67_18460, partial [Pseudomonadota bacterium]
ESEHETTIYYACLDGHRVKLGTSYPSERIIRKISRRARVAGVFPHGKTFLTLAAERLHHTAGDHWPARSKYRDSAARSPNPSTRRGEKGKERQRCLALPTWQMSGPGLTKNHRNGAPWPATFLETDNRR